jgi:hypothetical protein
LSFFRSALSLVLCVFIFTLYCKILKPASPASQIEPKSYRN